MVPHTWRIGLIGFGNVGQGFVRILARKGDELRRRYGFEYRLVGIADPVKGSVYDSNGLDPDLLIRLVDREGDIKSYPGGSKEIDSLGICRSNDIDIVVEVTPTNVETGEPGLTHLREALTHGKHVVTSNKGPIALAFPELRRLAEREGVMLRFEGTVLSGTPAINLALEAMAGIDINMVEGIVNGTTNFILTRMEEGKSYEEALREAQRLGYAEADPTADVEGWDAAVKAVIIANVLMGGEITVNDVEREGITKVSREEVLEALRSNERVKLIARVLRSGDGVKASVRPERVSMKHPLANVMGATNALTFDTDHLGKVTIIGPGAGRVETGQAILSDVLAIHRYYRGSKQTWR